LPYLPQFNRYSKISYLLNAHTVMSMPPSVFYPLVHAIRISVLSLPIYMVVIVQRMLACVAGPQFYGGPDLQRAGFWQAQGKKSSPVPAKILPAANQARHKIEGLPHRLNTCSCMRPACSDNFRNQTFQFY
jgi:hypothetical protein